MHPTRNRPDAALLVLSALLAACEPPSDLVFARDPVAPAEIAPGLYRATWNPTPDVVRGFTPDGARIIYQGRDLAGFGSGSYVLSVRLSDGVVREEAELYRRVLLDTVAHLVTGPDVALLVSWRSLEEGLVTCRGCPPPPPVLDLAIRRVPPSGVVPLASVPARTIVLPNHFTTDGMCADGSPAINLAHRIRIRPADLEILARRVNPFGPVETGDGSAGFYSDGEVIWRYDPSDPASAPDSVGPGAFPALSPDGLTLAAAAPVGVDSVSGQCQAGLCPCRQETVQIDATGWEIVLHDPGGGGFVTLGPGLEPVFDPGAARLAVRRPDALYWMDLATGEASEIAGTAGGYATAVAPDGSLLAFTANRFGNGDVFYVRIR